MKPETRLHSAVFQLTPTRTRCDLVISANGKTEKIASGLLNPFLAHLMAAQDQISKGGYSITLEPEQRGEHAPWFTKGTVERFVRFVSTPEVLERVSTIESEMLQIEEAISVQGDESLGSSTVDDHHQQTARPPKSLEGSKSLDADSEKAIVLYKAGSLPSQPDSTGYITQEENSKVQLLRVLETRKTMLQKEQAMAFARAAAASFDMDHMAHLISFAESFGASRLKKACVSYMELWKIKHETGQWLEVDAAEAMSFPPEFASLNGIILSRDIAEAGNDNNGELNSDHNRDQRHSPAQMPLGPQEQFHGQYQHPAYPQWPTHGQPMYQPYPMQGMPYYQNYPGNPPFFQPPYPPMEDPRFTNSQKTRRKRQSMDSKDAESDPSESSTKSPKDIDDGSEPEKEATEGRESRKRHGRSRKKQSGMVVIRNLNYISKRAETSGSESDSGSNSDAEDDTEGMLARILEGKHKKSGSSKKKDGHKKSTETSNAYVEDDVVSRREEDSGNWNAFQSSLLRAEENTSTVTGDMFAGERAPPVQRRNNQSEDDPLAHTERTSGDVRELRIADFDSVKSKVSRFNQIASDDVLLISSEGRGLRDTQQSSHFREMEGGGGYQRANDDFIVYGQEQHMGGRSSSDPLADYESNHIGNSDKKPYNATDESYMVPFRSGTQDQLGADRRATIDMDSEYPALKCPEKDSTVVKNQNFYEPDELTLMPERDFEDGSNGYDPARDYDYEVPIDVSANQESINQEVIPESVEDVPKKSENGKNLKVARKGMEKRKEPIVRKGAISKSSTLIEAQKRAEKLRAYKLDLQKEKKEKEEEGIRRLEALKREREKRIAARSGSGAAQSHSAKSSVSSSKGLKFGDSEAGSSSPLRKLSTRSSLVGSVDSQKIATASRVNVTTNGLSRSVSSLPELKKEFIKAESKADPMRLKRLSEPKVSSIDLAVKQKNTPKDPKTKISAITQLDKNKSATLPELKVKASKSPTAVQKSAPKETQKGSGSKTSPIPEIIQAKRSEEKAPRCSNTDDNAVLDPVVEKTVVILESGNVPAPTAQASKESIDTKNKSHKDDERDRTAPVSEYAAIRAPPSPIENEAYSIQSQLDVQLSSPEVVIPKESKAESQKSVDSTTVEKYQAPYARVSSMDDPAAIVEHSEAPRVLNSEVYTPVVESNFKADVPSSADQDSLEQNQEMSDKPRNKQSGFRKLLKFGRKSNSPASSEGHQDSDGSVVEDNEASASSNDVNLLKNLISQDDVYAGGASKSSRPFSLLSPFRKASDKKIQYA